MMTDKTTEAVARAINNAVGYTPWHRLPDLDSSYGSGRETRRKEARAAIAAHLKALEEAGKVGTGWKTIDSAPKGRSFWGWNESWFEPELCRWMGTYFEPKSAAEAMDRCGSAIFTQPTHWRPRTDIPDPPQIAAGEKA